MTHPARALIRVCAVACIASAVSGVAALVAFTVVVGTRPIGEAAATTAFYIPAVLALAAVVFLGVGLVGLYLYQQQRLGSLGTTAFVIALIGTMLAVGTAWTYVFVLPSFAAKDPTLVNVGSGSVLAGFLISYAVLAIGWVLFGAATLRAGVFGRAPAVAMIVGAVVAIVPLPSRSLLLSIVAALLGRRMLRQPGQWRL